jgi:hypothetical protein
LSKPETFVNRIREDVYRLKDDVAEILHIWHGAQDWR